MSGGAEPIDLALDSDDDPEDGFDDDVYGESYRDVSILFDEYGMWLT